MSTIPKAEDRFHELHRKSPSPPVTKYNTINKDLGNEVTSTLSRGARAKIGNNNISILDLEYGLKKAKETPGPGNYERHTDFVSKTTRC